MLQEAGSQIPRYDLFTLVTNLLSIAVTLAAVWGWYSRRKRKQRAKFQEDLRPIIDTLRDGHGKTLTTTEIQSLVTAIVKQVSYIHFGKHEPPEVETGITFRSGESVPCRTCRGSVIVRERGACPNCHLHHALWWGSPSQQQPPRAS
jgi:hypothetical protein